MPETYAHIRQVGRAALPVIVPNKATAELEYGADVYCADFDRPRPRAAMASTLPDITSQLTSHLRQVSWGMIEQNCFERKQILSDCNKAEKCISLTDILNTLACGMDSKAYYFRSH